MKISEKLVSIVFLSLTLIGCKDNNEETKKLEKTHLNYTYSDVCSNYYRNSNAIPNSGEPRLLVLPLYFSDSQEFIPEDKKDTVLADIRTSFFGSKEEIGNDSVSSYYTTLSSGKCTLKGTVSNWINVDESYMNYSVDESATTLLVDRLVENYFSTANDIRSTYDLDNNGFLDGVVVIYAAPDYNNFRDGSSTYSNLWAYTNWTNNKSDVETPTACNFIWASYDFMYSRSTAALKTGKYYGSGDTSYANLDTHIYIHEIGHMFGLIDYYDYSYQFSPAGAFSMQDHNVGSHDPYSVMALGWCDPYIPTESCSITLNSFQSSRDCIILCNTWNDINSPFDEYLLIEYYTPDGLNEFDHLHSYLNSRATGPNESGIRLWHVDARLLYDSLKDPNKVTCNPKINSKVAHMMSNTYSASASSGSRAYTSPLGASYTKFNLLQLIRNEEVETYQPHNSFDKYSLFVNGSKFSMNTFAKQFPINAKMNNGKVLGWTFSVELTENQAKINLTRTL